jgi:hypothetical protein
VREQKVQDKNITELADNIFIQISWILDNVINVCDIFVYPNKDLDKQQKIMKLKNRINKLSSYSDNSLALLRAWCYKDWVHSTCKPCNIDQTQEMKFWRTVAAIVGVKYIGNLDAIDDTQPDDDEKEEDEPDEEDEEDEEEEGSEMTAAQKAAKTAEKVAEKGRKNAARVQRNVEIRKKNKDKEKTRKKNLSRDFKKLVSKNRSTALEIIVTNTEITVKKRIFERYAWGQVEPSRPDPWFECISLFINFLTIMNIQTSAMCLQAATCLNPLNGERKQKENNLKLGRWETASALLATAVLNKSIHMINLLAFKNQKSFNVTMSVDMMWKYLIVECAAKNIVDTTTFHHDLSSRVQQADRRFRTTVYEYIFGPAYEPNTFSRERMELPGVYLTELSGVIRNACISITNLLTDARGTSVLMFSIKRTDRTITSRSELFGKKLQIPSTQMTWSQDITDDGEIGLGDTWIERTRSFFKRLHRRIAPEEVIYARMTALKQSQLTIQASPSAVLKKMRSTSKQGAVADMFRLPLILIEMEHRDMRARVRDRLIKAMLSKNPLRSLEH